MEIHQLQYIVAVAKHQNFTRAADEICLSQSSLSQQVGKLEEELGVRLFDRTTRSVALTPAGREFVAFSKRILAEIERSRQCMEKYVTLERGQIIIGALPIIGQLGLISLIAEFQNAYPGIQLEIREAGSRDLLDWLNSAEIDVAFLTPPDNLPDDIETYPLLEDDLVLVTAKNHPLAGREVISLNEVAEERFISLNQHSGMYNVFLDACHKSGFNPNIAYTTSQVDTTFGLVAEGLGVAILSWRIARSSSLQDRLSIIKLDNKYTRVTALAVPKHPYVSPTIAAFREFTLNWVEKNK